MCLRPKKHFKFSLKFRTDVDFSSDFGSYCCSVYFWSSFLSRRVAFSKAADLFVYLYSVGCAKWPVSFIYIRLLVSPLCPPNHVVIYCFVWYEKCVITFHVNTIAPSAGYTLLVRQKGITTVYCLKTKRIHLNIQIPPPNKGHLASAA
jgi:hypothetical protein